VAVYKDEYKLWRETNATQRALMLRDHADMFWLMIQMQHERMTGWEEPKCFDEARTQLVRQRLDVDMFMMAMSRLLVVAQISEKTADPRSVMPAAMAAFATDAEGMVLDPFSPMPSTITDARNALEHWSNLKKAGGLGFARGDDGWYVSYRDKMFGTARLLDAARDLHHAIREAIDPEAFADPRSDVPFVELRSPDEVPPVRRPLYWFTGPSGDQMIRWPDGSSSPNFLEEAWQARDRAGQPVADASGEVRSAPRYPAVTITLDFGRLAGALVRVRHKLVRLLTHAH
jgi:hypothetical protein